MDSDEKISEFLMALAKQGSDNFIKVFEKLGVTFEGLEKVDLSRKLVQEQFNIGEKEFRAVDCVFWIAFAVERNAKELIVFPEVGVGIRFEFVDFLYRLFVEYRQKELASKFEILRDTNLSKDQRQEALEFLLDSLPLGSKVRIIEHFYSSKENLPFIQLMKEVVRLRNDIAHGRVTNLTYKSYLLSSGKGQFVLFTDLMNVMSKK